MIERSSWKTCRALGAVLGVRSFRRKPERSAEAVRNLQISFPSMNETRALQIVRRARQSDMMNICEMLRLRATSPEEVRDYVQIEGMEHLHDAMKDGRGVVLATAHFGPYNLMGARLAQEFALTSLSLGPAGSKMQKHVTAARQAMKMQIFSPEGGAWTSVLALRAQGAVCIFADLPGSHSDPIETFLNHTGHIQSNAARLAMTAACPLVPIFAVRNRPWVSGGKIVLKVCPPLRLEGRTMHNPQDYKAEIQRATRYGLEAINAIVKQHPDEWHHWHIAQQL